MPMKRHTRTAAVALALCAVLAGARPNVEPASTADPSLAPVTEPAPAASRTSLLSSRHPHHSLRMPFFSFQPLG